MKNKTFKDFVQRSGSALVMPIIMIVLGLFLIIWADKAVDMAVRIIGVVVLVVAAGMACTLVSNMNHATLAFSIVLGCVGLICIITPGFVSAYVLIIIGFFILVNAIVRIIDAYKIKGNSDNFVQYIVNDLITLGVGFLVIIFNRFIIDSLARVSGIIILVLGITNLITAIGVYNDRIITDDGVEVMLEDSERRR